MALSSPAFSHLPSEGREGTISAGSCPGSLGEALRWWEPGTAGRSCSDECCPTGWGAVSSLIYFFLRSAPSVCMFVSELPRTSHLLRAPAVFTFFFLEMSPCLLSPASHLQTLSNNSLKKLTRLIVPALKCAPILLTQRFFSADLSISSCLFRQ